MFMSLNNEAIWISALCLQTSNVSGKLMLNPATLQNQVTPSCRNHRRQNSVLLPHLLPPRAKLLSILSPSMDIAGNFWFDMLGKWLYGITDLV